MSSSRLAALLKGDTDNTFIQLFRYLFVGGGAFVVDFSTLYILTQFLNIHYLVSAAAGFLLGLACNYLLSVRWVFSQRKVENRTAEFALFAWIGIAGLVMNEAIMWVAVSVFAAHYLVAKVISTVIVFLWNFLARKYMLFNRADTVAIETE